MSTYPRSTVATFVASLALLASGFAVSAGAQSQVLTGHDGVVKSITVSPDGNHFISGSYDKTARMWSLEDGTPFVIAPITPMHAVPWLSSSPVPVAQGKSWPSGQFCV